MLYKTGSRSISFGEIVSQEITSFLDSTGEKGSFYVTVLRDDKIFLDARDFNQKRSFL